jgi:hypothetical protein
MIISHQHKFIFLRIPKTASTSIQIALAAVCGPEDVLSGEKIKDGHTEVGKHYTPQQNLPHHWRNYTLKDWHQLIFKRKPINYVHARANQAIKIAGKDNWKRYFKFCFVRNPFDRIISQYYWATKNWEQKYKTPTPAFNDWIYTIPKSKISTWSRYTIHNHIAVNFIGRYESLGADLGHITNQLNLPELPIQKTKTTIRKDHRHYSEVISPSCRRYIEKVCRKEMKAFDYSWNDETLGET